MAEVKGVLHLLGEPASKLAELPPGVPVARQTQEGWGGYLSVMGGLLLPARGGPFATSGEALSAAVELLAEKFASNLRAWLSPEEMAAVNERNRLDNDPMICHSHDFCDANMAMHNAVVELRINSEDVPSWSDEMVALLNAAWEVARRNNFYVAQGSVQQGREAGE
ncbi:hypothetical protein SGO26_30200 (plasmid) [Cupriavidus metallidurans]|uniref:hypothetical protein n=1 Tax=Cupriavidus metallidurans TaxID=119219 RepID=UPI003D70D190